MHNELGVNVSPPFFLHPALHPPHRSPPLNDHGQKWPKAVKTGAQGEAFTRNILYFKRLRVNRREHTRGEAFTRNTLTLNILQAKGEEVKAKNRKTPDARASRVRVGRSPRANLRPSWAGGEKTPLGAPPSREKIVTSQSVPLPSSLGAAPHCGNPRPLRHADGLHQRRDCRERLPCAASNMNTIATRCLASPTGAHGLRGSRHDCCCPTRNTSKPSPQTQAHYKVFGGSRLFCRSLCLMPKGSD